MINTEKAREELKRAFPFTEVSTQYIARYNSKTGKEIAIERERSDAYYLWVQKPNPEMPGVTIRNEKFPGQPYDRKQSRNSNLNDKNAPKLKLGNKVWYLKIEDMSALKEFIDWYSSH